MKTQTDKDAEPQGEGRDEMVVKLRRSIGSASSAYMGGRTRFARLWNWALDTEYVAVGPPPIAWILIGVAGITFGVCVLVAMGGSGG